MVSPSQHLFIIIIWLMCDFRMRDGCDGFPMAVLNMRGGERKFINILQIQKAPENGAIAAFTGRLVWASQPLMPACRSDVRKPQHLSGYAILPLLFSAHHRECKDSTRFQHRSCSVIP